MKFKKSGIYILLLSLCLIKTSLAINLDNPFEGKWVSDSGSVNVSKCKNNKCSIDISTANGAYTCELDGELTVLSNQKAIFYLSLEEKKTSSVSLDLNKQVISVYETDKGHEVKDYYCGARGFFEDDYTNSTFPKIYSASFDCYKASTKIEIAICRSRKIAYYDRVMAELYTSLKIKRLEQILNQQKKWLIERDKCTSSSDLIMCLSDKYLERINAMQGDILNKSPYSRSVDSYNYDYLLYLSKLPNKQANDILWDPILQTYIKSNINQSIYNRLSTIFYETSLEQNDNSMIVIEGGSPDFTRYMKVLWF